MAARRAASNRRARRPLRKKVIRNPDGWPVDRFAVIERAWAGKIVVCIGGGPSVAAANLTLVREAHAAGRCRVIVVNDAYLLAPFADLVYFADARWWMWHKDRPEFKAFAGEKVTIENTGAMVSDFAVHMLRNSSQSHPLPGEEPSGGLSEAPNALRTGCNGGYQAVNIATLAGAARVLLVGYDMHFPGGKSHWHRGHFVNGREVKTPEDRYFQYARAFKSMRAPLEKIGCEVVNCTPGSRIAAFRFSTLEAELAACP